MNAALVNRTWKKGGFEWIIHFSTVWSEIKDHSKFKKTLCFKFYLSLCKAYWDLFCSYIKLRDFWVWFDQKTCTCHSIIAPYCCDIPEDEHSLRATHVRPFRPYVRCFIRSCYIQSLAHENSRRSAIICHNLGVSEDLCKQDEALRRLTKYQKSHKNMDVAGSMTRERSLNK